MLHCPVCSIEEGKSTLETISINHEEYQLSLKTNDGTRKWYTCNQCQNTFCRDKIKGIWLYSPSTYIKLLNNGFIEDKLEG
jgi:hypothetical protein